MSSIKVNYPSVSKSEGSTQHQYQGAPTDTILSQLHPLRMRTYQPTSTLILLLKTNGRGSYTTEHRQGTSGSILNPPEHYFSELKKKLKKS